MSMMLGVQPNDLRNILAVVEHGDDPLSEAEQVLLRNYQSQLVSVSDARYKGIAITTIQIPAEHFKRFWDIAKGEM